MPAGQSSRRKLQQGPGGGTCQNGPRSAQYRCPAAIATEALACQSKVKHAQLPFSRHCTLPLP